MVKSILVKGTENSLDGRVIIYSKCWTPYYNKKTGELIERDNPYIAFYYSDDSKALFDKLPEFRKDLVETIGTKKEYVEFNRGIMVPKKIIERFLDGEEGVINLGQKIEMYDEDFRNFSEDILYVGECVDDKEGFNKIRTMSDLYFRNMKKQKVRPLTHKDFYGDSLKKFIKKRFIDKMVAASVEKEYYIYLKVLGELEKFSKDSNFYKQIPGLSIEIEKGFNEEYIDEPKVRKYVSLMDSIHLENYWHSTILEREIKGLF